MRNRFEILTVLLLMTTLCGYSSLGQERNSQAGNDSDRDEKGASTVCNQKREAVNHDRKDRHELRDLNGHYAFVLLGFDSSVPALDPAGPAVAIAGSFVADGQGNLTDGVEDIQSASGVTHTSFTGTYTIAADDRGTVSLSTGQTFDLSLGWDTSSGIATAGRMITTDSVVASGVLKKQETNVRLGDLRGDFAFGLTGEILPGNSTPGGRSGHVGQVTVDAAGNVTGEVDDNDAGIVVLGTITGSFSPISGGRTTLTTVNSNHGAAHHALYVVSADELFMIGLDPVTADNTPPIEDGVVLRQCGAGSFTNDSLNGISVLYAQGLSDGNPIGLGSKVELSLVQTDGNGNFSFLENDGNDGGIFQSHLIGGTYDVAPEGRVTISIGGPTGPVMYLVSRNKAFFLDETIVGPAGGSFESGFFEPQSEGPFTIASGVGDFFVGDEPPAVNTAAVGAGVVILDGAGNINGARDQNSAGTITTQTVTETMIVSPDGRAVTSAGDIIYYISPFKAVSISERPGDMASKITVI